MKWKSVVERAPGWAERAKKRRETTRTNRMQRPISTERSPAVRITNDGWKKGICTMILGNDDIPYDCSASEREARDTRQPMDENGMNEKDESKKGIRMPKPTARVCNKSVSNSSRSRVHKKYIPFSSTWVVSTLHSTQIVPTALHHTPPWWAHVFAMFEITAQLELLAAYWLIPACWLLLRLLFVDWLVNSANSPSPGRIGEEHSNLIMGEQR